MMHFLFDFLTHQRVFEQNLQLLERMYNTYNVRLLVDLALRLLEQLRKLALLTPTIFRNHGSKIKLNVVPI